MERSTTIRFTSLPHRARRLDEGDLGRLFGGCRGARQDCGVNCDCCPGLSCVSFGSTSVEEGRQCIGL
jgi:hypothetical protein